MFITLTFKPSSVYSPHLFPSFGGAWTFRLAFLGLCPVPMTFACHLRLSENLTVCLFFCFFLKLFCEWHISARPSTAELPLIIDKFRTQTWMGTILEPSNYSGCGSTKHPWARCCLNHLKAVTVTSSPWRWRQLQVLYLEVQQEGGGGNAARPLPPLDYRNLASRNIQAQDKLSPLHVLSQVISEDGLKCFWFCCGQLDTSLARTIDQVQKVTRWKAPGA